MSRKAAKKQVPTVKLYNGARIPIIGLGTFGSDHCAHEKVAEAVKFAIQNGYRLIDCAKVYSNEAYVGQALKAVLEAGTVQRKDLVIISKLANQDHQQVEAACRQTLADLQLDYLDIYMIHWPVPNYHAPGCSVDSHDPNAVPFSIERYMKTWTDMESLVKKGLVKNIACSNMSLSKMKLLLERCKIKPVANELEMHPCFQQRELKDYLVKNQIVPIAYCPIGSPNRPDRDRTDEDEIDVDDPIVTSIAKRLDIHPATLCVKWAAQRGTVPIPMSANPRNILANLEAVVSKPLTKNEMKEMEKCEKNSRLIKGQVFMWEGSKGWEDLWE